MEEHFGQRLARARMERGLTIEEAAHVTRISSSYIRALEEANLSKFPNAAYAKSFLLMYAKHLGLNVKEEAAMIDTSTQMKVEDFQYLTSRAKELQKEEAASKQEPEDRYGFVVPERGSRSWTPLFIVAGIVAVVAIAFIVWSNINRLGNSPTPSAQTSQATPAPTPATPEPEAPRPKVIAPPKDAAVTGTPPTEAADPNIPVAIPVAKAISPVARMAANDAAELADIPAGRTPVPTPNVIPGAPAAPNAQAIPAVPEEETNTPPEDPNIIILDPQKKSWVVIRATPGGQPLFEDYLYPNAKPMRLPAGRYYIELRDASAIEISKAGRRIAYRAPGVIVE